MSEVNIRPFQDLKKWAAGSDLSSPFNQEVEDEIRTSLHCDVRESCSEKSCELRSSLNSDRTRFYLFLIM